MVPNHPQLSSAKTKRKSNRNVFGVWSQQAGLLQAIALQPEQGFAGRRGGWADQEKKRNMETWQWQKSSSMFKKELSAHDIKMGRDKFFEVLRNNNLLIKPKRIRAKTTCSYHHFNKYKNLVKGALPQRCNAILVSDITYVWLKQQDTFCYLSVVTDLYSRKIVGHYVHEDLSVKGSLEALKQL